VPWPAQARTEDNHLVIEIEHEPGLWIVSDRPMHDDPNRDYVAEIWVCPLTDNESVAA
jgi:hypothetical protein